MRSATRALTGHSWVGGIPPKLAEELLKSMTVCLDHDGVAFVEWIAERLVFGLSLGSEADDGFFLVDTRGTNSLRKSGPISSVDYNGLLALVASA